MASKNDAKAEIALATTIAVEGLVLIFTRKNIYFRLALLGLALGLASGSAKNPPNIIRGSSDRYQWFAVEALQTRENVNLDCNNRKKNISKFYTNTKWGA